MSATQLLGCHSTEVGGLSPLQLMQVGEGMGRGGKVAEASFGDGRGCDRVVGQEGRAAARGMDS